MNTTNRVYCTGSDEPPAFGTVRGRGSGYPGVGECSGCGRELKLRASDGLIRRHR